MPLVILRSDSVFFYSMLVVASPSESKQATFLFTVVEILYVVRFVAVTVVLSIRLIGVQHVPGDAGGFHPAAPGRFAGLVVCPAHPVAEEDGC